MNSIHISTPTDQFLSELKINKTHEMHYRQFSERIGEQVGQIVTDLLAEIIALIIVNRSSTSKQLSAHTSTSIEMVLTASEVASILKISKSKVYQLIRVGKIPSVKIDRTARVRLRDLNKFIDDHTV